MKEWKELTESEREEWEESATGIEEECKSICEECKGCNAEDVRVMGDSFCEACDQSIILDSSGGIEYTGPMCYWQGSGERVCILSVPWDGTGESLYDEIAEQCFDW